MTHNSLWHCEACKLAGAQHIILLSVSRCRLPLNTMQPLPGHCGCPQLIHMTGCSHVPDAKTLPAVIGLPAIAITPVVTRVPWHCAAHGPFRPGNAGGIACNPHNPSQSLAPLALLRVWPTWAILAIGGLGGLHAATLTAHIPEPYQRLTFTCCVARSHQCHSDPWQRVVSLWPAQVAQTEKILACGWHN